jgi:hypothetical protein
MVATLAILLTDVALLSGQGVDRHGSAKPPENRTFGRPGEWSTIVQHVFHSTAVPSVGRQAAIPLSGDR